ncbi:BTAD domain-containing putative transcriptional regulator [Umezawaea endophytica]|uniref:AAA family ATPase n=1 Tax=Umezawaea endophytica TaxID=1654476 RepID=A0A9X2VG02_9PSEU|nr:BTAD domain-containing putative transcriptional regulator [Umezawaea endophytica]MCS7475960.1 AAA family ATPase [Umezawaea endophytica]
MQEASGKQVHVELLGPVRAVLGGVEIPLGPSRQRAVFAVLASRAGQAVSREELIDQVWGESAPVSAPGSVYTYVSALRRALAEAGVADSKDTLFSTKHGYALRLDPHRVDTVAFDKLFARSQVLAGSGDHRGAAGTLEQALGLFRGEPFSGVPGPFADHMRTRWAERRVAAVEALATSRLVLGAHVELAAELGALVQDYPLRESLRALLMIALSRGGRQAEALAVFRDARETLAREVGAKPGPALRHAHAVVLSGEEAPSPAEPAEEEPEEEPAGVSVLRHANSQVFVGREAETDRLRARLVDVAAGVGGTVWIEGEPGIGKTELLAIGLADAERLGCHVGWAVADELAGRFPLQVLLECLGVDQSSSDPDRADLARRLRTGEPSSRGTDDDDPIQSAVDRLLALVDRMCHRAPTVLVLDDLQWADESSVSLWRRLAAATRQLPLLLVTCSRSRHGRAELDQLRSRVRANDGDVLVLEPLTYLDVDSMTAEMVGGRPGHLLRRLTARAAGNPLYLREMVGALVRDQAVDLIDGVAHVDEAQADDAPRTLFAAVQRTSQALPERTREVLRWAAVLGAEATIAQIAALSDRLVPEVARAVKDAMAANVLGHGEPRLLFRHPLLREAVYGSITAPMRGVLHKQAARALAEGDAPPSRVAEQLVAAASDLDPWVGDWLIGSAAELSNRAPLIAADLLEQSLDLVGPRDPNRELLLTALVRVLFRLARNPDAEARQALAISTDPARSAELRQLLAATLLRQDKRELALRTLTEVEVDPSVPKIWQLRHKSLLAHLRRDVTYIDEAEVTGKAAHAEAVSNGDAYLIAHALQTLWLVESVRRNHRTALRYVDDAIAAVVDAPELAGMYFNLLDNKMFTLQNLDQLDEVDVALATVDELTVKHGLPVGPQISAAVHHYWTGRWDEALLELDTVTEDGPAISYSGLVDPGPNGLLLHGVSALIALHRHDTAASTAHLDAADELLVVTAAEREACDFLLLARSLAAVQSGDVRRGLDAVKRILNPAYADMMLRHQWLPDILRLALEVGDHERVAEVMEVAELEAAREAVPTRAYTALHRCKALVTGDPEPALVAVGHYRQVGRRVELAAALDEASVLLAKAGKRADARGAFAEAAEIFTELDAKWDLARAQARMDEFGIRHDVAASARATGGWDTLTPVERRIAELVASGQSNPDIAIRLSLPRRMVQAHVTRILGKLGVRSRSQIAERHHESGRSATGR